LESVSGGLSPHSSAPGCKGNCESCARAAAPAATRPSMGKETARRGLRRLQTVSGLLLLASGAAGIYLLATDKSLWLLAVSHAVGLVMIVIIDFALGLYSLASPKSAYLPSIAGAFLGLVLQVGDVFTAPQYNMTIPYFAHYLFGLGAFDLLIALQGAVIVVGIAGMPHARYLARRKTRRGKELDYTRRGFMKALASFAGLVGLGVVVGSVKIPAPANNSLSTASVSRTGTAQGAVANVNSLKTGVPVYFEYPSGYPNALMKNSDGSLTAVSMLCTHVCCQLSYIPTAKIFYCQCHQSEFDLSGKVIRGPAYFDLPTIKLRVDGSGNVFPTGVSNPGPCQV
jgi:cytochrome b6-f complex iron-sulfur subunit